MKPEQLKIIEDISNELTKRSEKGLSMAMVQRLRARFNVPADLLLPPLKKAPARRSAKRAVA